MCYGQNLNGRLFLAINDCEGEASQYKPPRLVVENRPPFWRFENQLNGLVNVADEVVRAALTTRQIPRYGRLEFFECFGVNLEAFTGHSGLQRLDDEPRPTRQV